MHPLLLPTLITDLETSLTLRDCEEWTEALGRLEAETGQNPNDTHGIGQYQQVNSLKLDFPSIVHRLNACSVFVRIIERESEGAMDQLHQMLETIDKMKKLGPPLHGGYFQDSSNRLMQHVEFLIASRKSISLRLRSIQRGTQTQLDVVRPSKRLIPFCV
jgi:hypothetical protein